MYLHANAKLGLAGRFALVTAVEVGMSLKGAAVAFSVSPATAHRWWHRWLEASEEARATLACLFDRSSRPHRSPRQLAPADVSVVSFDDDLIASWVKPQLTTVALPHYALGRVAISVLLDDDQQRPGGRTPIRRIPMPLRERESVRQLTSAPRKRRATALA